METNKYIEPSRPVEMMEDHSCLLPLLLDGEQIIWSGRPVIWYFLMERMTPTIFGVYSSYFFLLYLGVDSKFINIVALIFLPFYAWSENDDAKKTFYAVSNKRIFIGFTGHYRDGRYHANQGDFFFYDRDYITHIDAIVDSRLGLGSVYFNHFSAFLNLISDRQKEMMIREDDGLEIRVISNFFSKFITSSLYKTHNGLVAIRDPMRVAKLIQDLGLAREGQL